jgi:hypothetical protein
MEEDDHDRRIERQIIIHLSYRLKMKGIELTTDLCFAELTYILLMHSCAAHL